jgi:hypothetical protein
MPTRIVTYVHRPKHPPRKRKAAPAVAIVRATRRKADTPPRSRTSRSRRPTTTRLPRRLLRPRSRLSSPRPSAAGGRSCDAQQGLRDVGRRCCSATAGVRRLSRRKADDGGQLVGPQGRRAAADPGLVGARPSYHCHDRGDCRATASLAASGQVMFPAAMTARPVPARHWRSYGNAWRSSSLRDRIDPP